MTFRNTVASPQGYLYNIGIFDSINEYLSWNTTPSWLQPWEGVIYLLQSDIDKEYYIVGVDGPDTTDIHWATSIGYPMGDIEPTELSCLKFSGPTELHTTSIVIGTSEEETSEFFRNPAWDDVKDSTTMYCWALPKGGIYTDTLTPVALTTHVWGKMGDDWTDLSTLEENPISIYLARTDAFTSLSLRAGVNVEVSDDGHTWSTWSPNGYILEAEVDDEGATITTYGDRFPEGDQTIESIVYHCWLSKPYDIFTLAEVPTAGDVVYSITEGVATSAGTVSATHSTGYYHEVVDGVVYVRAKTGSEPLYGFSGLFAKVEGPVMSLVDYEHIDTAVLSSCQFARVIYYGGYDEAGLFYDVNNQFLEGSSAPFLSDASGLIMPGEDQVASTSHYALSMMFNNCLTLGGDKLPELTTPAIAQGLYDCFCYGCISIKHLPEDYLADTFTSTPGPAPYAFMFSQCASLEDIPDGFLDTNYLGGVFWSEEYWGYQSAYTEMFSNCWSLKSVPTDLLPATTLTPCCYGHMFMNCVSLENAPELNAETLASGCYKGMFEGCSSITSAPDLPATTLPSEVVVSGVDSPRGCYQRMFMGCSEITTSPALRARVLKPYCYSEMFEDCSRMSDILCEAAAIDAEECTASWVSGVESEGIFRRNETTWAYWPISVSGIPEGWTITPERPADHLAVQYVKDGTTTHLAFVRDRTLDDWNGDVRMYAWTIGTWNFDTVWTNTLAISSEVMLYVKDGDNWVQSTAATIESTPLTDKVSIVIENSATNVLSNGITFTVSEGSYANTLQTFVGAMTNDTSVTVNVSGSSWKWYDDESTTNPRTEDTGIYGLYLIVDNA